jgi:hypothetical protein
MRILLLVYFALFIVMASSCQKSKEAGASVNSACVSQPTSCNSSAYQQNSGYSSYPNNSGNPFLYAGNSAYLCSCPYGSIPTYNSYAGLGCVQTSYFNFSFYSGFSLGYTYLGWNQNQWSLQSQLSTYGANCYSGAVQSCVAGQNTCPAGSSCMQSSRNSNLGLCVTSYR